MSRTSPRTTLRRVAATAVVALVGLGLASAPADAQSRAPQPSGYVAVGDSFAAGEGLAPYETGTDTATDQCHRSTTQSYPELLQRSPLPRFDDLTSRACSGAITASLVAALPGAAEPPQLAGIPATTRTITMTIGGNDIGFGPVLADCVWTPVPELKPFVKGEPGCAKRNDAAVQAQLARLAGTGPGLPGVPTVPVLTLLGAAQAAAPQADIYLSGYPLLFGTTMTSAAGCQVGAVGPAPLYVAGSDTAWIRSRTAQLNHTLKVAARQARALGVHAHYVDVTAAFAGHNLCDRRSSWINGVVLAPTSPPQLSSASFHPTAEGQRAYAVSLGGPRARGPLS